MEDQINTRIRRLYAAAYAGDISLLRELLEEDKLLLERAITATHEVSDNPLHVASVRGNAEFAKEILQWNPNLALELNGQGLTPLHLAAAHGHRSVVAELLEVDSGLCCIRENKQGYMPVHTAVIKGRYDVVNLLIEKSEGILHELTIRSETLLHLAIKSNCLEIVQFLTAQGVVLNAKDVNENTSLHLAVGSRQERVIKHLLSEGDIDVNSINLAGLTPLDVLLVSNHEIGDLYLGEMLRAAGGKTAKELGPSDVNLINSSSIDANITSQARLNSTPSNQMTRTRSKAKETSKNNIEKDLIVVATLVATVTFAAALNPPGGAIQMPFSDSDRKNPDWFRNWKHMDTIYPAGSPVYLWKLKMFFMYDYFALFASVSVILLCLPGVIPRSNTMRKLLVLVLWSSIFFMVIAFNNALSILLYRDRNYRKFPEIARFFKIWIYFFALVSAPLFVDFIFSLIAKVAWKAKKQLIPSWMRNRCTPKLKRALRWTLIKRTLSFFSMIAIAFFVGWGIGWAISEMANSSTS